MLQIRNFRVILQVLLHIVGQSSFISADSDGDLDGVAGGGSDLVQNDAQTVDVVIQHLQDAVDVQVRANLSDAVIALPGGCGTLEELLEIITWKQLGLYLNPIVILNINHYYDPLLELLRNAMNENFMRPQHAKMWAVADTPEEAIRLIHAEPKWDASLRKIAAI